MPHTDFRLPAEWERHSAMLMAWPAADGDWAGRLGAIRDEYTTLVATVSEHQDVVLLTPPGDASAGRALGRRTGLHFLEVACNDTWCRDYGPITLTGAGRRLALDFHFDGWGGRHEAALDNRVNACLARTPLFQRLDFRQYLFELEGGAIDSDGRGTLLVNRHCLRARHPHLSRAEQDDELMTLLNAGRVIGIDMPPLPGDDTDGHVDTLARFIDAGTLAFQLSGDGDRDRRLRGQLEALRRADERAYDLIALPAAGDTDSGLPLSYANFAFINDACLVPAFGIASDREAAAILAEALPAREVIPVPAATLITQSGGPHCATMHIPAALQ